MTFAFPDDIPVGVGATAIVGGLVMSTLDAVYLCIKSSHARHQIRPRDDEETFFRLRRGSFSSQLPPSEPSASSLEIMVDPLFAFLEIKCLVAQATASGQMRSCRVSLPRYDKVHSRRLPGDLVIAYYPYYQTPLFWEHVWKIPATKVIVFFGDHHASILCESNFQKTKILAGKPFFKLTHQSELGTVYFTPYQVLVQSTGDLLSIVQSTSSMNPVLMTTNPNEFKFAGTSFALSLIFQIISRNHYPSLPGLETYLNEKKIVFDHAVVNQVTAQLNALPASLKPLLLNGLVLNDQTTSFTTSLTYPYEENEIEKDDDYLSYQRHQKMRYRQDRSRIDLCGPYQSNAYPCEHFTHQKPYAFDLTLIEGTDPDLSFPDERKYSRHLVMEYIKEKKVTLVVQVGPCHTQPPWFNDDSIQVITLDSEATEEAIIQAAKGHEIALLFRTHTPPCFFNASILPTGHLLTPIPIRQFELPDKFETVSDFNQMLIERKCDLVVQTSGPDFDALPDIEHLVIEDVRDIKSLFPVLKALNTNRPHTPVVVMSKSGSNEAGLFVAADLLHQIYQLRQQTEGRWSVDPQRLIKFLSSPPHGRDRILTTSEDLTTFYTYIQHYKSLDLRSESSA